MKRIILFLMLVVSMTVFAQQDGQKPRKKLVVADIETRVPMRNVVVSTEDGYRDTTNWRGICYVPATFDTLTIAKANYIPERMTQKELKDSTFLIPSGSAIGEVEVWGKNHIQDNVDSWQKYKPLPSGPGSIATFDLARMLDKRGRRDAKHLRKIREKFQEAEDKEDPIVNAYKKALAEKERAARDASRKSASLKNKED